MEMETTTENQPDRRSRRKACDLCFTKKIKCDQTKPRCSHCKIYNAAACTFTPLTRKVNPNKTVSSNRADSLEARLRELEARLRDVESKDSRPKGVGITTDITGPVPEGAAAVAGERVSSAHAVLEDTQRANNLVLTPESLTELIGGGPSVLQAERYYLPPLVQVLPFVSEYFATSNRVMPLFHEQSFMRMLRDWYTTPDSQHNPAIWAAINIVLALSRRRLYLDISSPRGTLDVYVKNAQSVLNQLITRDEDLLGIQVVLGLALIFYGTSDPKPATVLVATAVRLAHALSLNARCASNAIDSEQAEQGRNIFWVLYILDRDIAMRIQQPSMLHEADIDVEVPIENPADGAGILYAANGTRINFFRKRVQFAWIQGKIYEWLFSVRAQRLFASQKEENMRRVERAIDRWYDSLAEEFKPEMLPGSDLTTFRAFITLHFIHLQALALIHRSYSYNAAWLETLRRYSSSVTEAQGSTEYSRAPFPESWDKLVDKSRACMKLFSCLPQKDLYIVWSMCCSFFTTLIFLSVNSLANPHLESLDEDQKLVKFAIDVINRIVDETQNESMAKMRNACVELDANTRIVVERAQSRSLRANAIDQEIVEFSGGLISNDQGLTLDSNGHGTGASDSEFFGAMGLANEALDPELFASWLDEQFYSTVSPRPGYHDPLPADPNFDPVVAEFIKQRWF